MHWIKRHTKSAIVKAAVVCLAIAALSLPSTGPVQAQAQLMDQLKGAVGSGQNGSSGGGVLGSGGLPSVGQASPSNTAGVLQYCIQNKYVGSGGAASVKDSLMSKAGQGTNDIGYKAGSSGQLQTGNGQNFSLGGDGVKAQITQKLCEQVLQHAKSLL